MADYNSSLPVRTESAGDLAVKVVDALLPSQGLTVNADGSTNITDNGGSLTVDAVDLDIRDLAFATDSVDVSGSEVALDAATLAALENITVSATDLDIRDLSAATDSVAIKNGANQMAVNADGSLNVVVSNDIPGNEVSDHQTSASLAAGATSNHDYTVTATKTLTMEQLVVAGSGKLKVQVLVNGVAKLMLFNSAAEPTISVPLARVLKGASGQVVRIAITNRDQQAQDVYSTLLGSET